MKKKMTAGFTLVELIVVIAILGILAGVGTVGYSGYIKKANEAADNQLLGVINHAFATACLENGVDAKSVTGASMPLTGEKGEKKVDVANVSPYADAFAKYYAGNENSAFKQYTHLLHKNGVFEGRIVNISTDDATGAMTYTFEDGSSYTVTSEQVEAIKNSTYGKNMTMDQLLGEVTGMVDAMNSALGGGKTLATVLFGNNEEEWKSWGIRADSTTEKEKFKKQVSNAAVLYVANKMTADTTDTIVGALKDETKGIQSLMSGSQDTVLVNMAGLYGIATGFVHSDAAGEWEYEEDGKTYNAAEYYDYINDTIAAAAGDTTMDSTQKYNAIVGALGKMENLINEGDQFDEYKKAQLDADANGLANAMTAIDSNSDSLITSGAIANGFGSGDISDILNVIMGG